MHHTQRKQNVLRAAQAEIHLTVFLILEVLSLQEQEERAQEGLQVLKGRKEAKPKSMAARRFLQEQAAASPAVAEKVPAATTAATPVVSIPFMSLTSL